MERVLELKNVHYSYHTLEGETPALTDISFALGKGEFIAIVGPSGCGKSTLLSLIAGLLSPEEGTIRINGKNQIEENGCQQEAFLQSRRCGFPQSQRRQIHRGERLL